MESKYLTWDGKPIDVRYTMTGPPNGRGSGPTPEPLVKRTFVPSDELHDAIFNQRTGVFRDETAIDMAPRDRSSWLHLWDGVQCRTISTAEAYEAVRLGYVPMNLTARASNYMHLI